MLNTKRHPARQVANHVYTWIDAIVKPRGTSTQPSRWWDLSRLAEALQDSWPTSCFNGLIIPRSQLFYWFLLIFTHHQVNHWWSNWRRTGNDNLFFGFQPVGGLVGGGRSRGSRPRGATDETSGKKRFTYITNMFTCSWLDSFVIWAWKSENPRQPIELVSLNQQLGV